MAVTATAVKELRQRTGAGMMDCKRALTEAEGDVDAAIKILRTKGLAAAAKKAHRAASEGMVVVLGDTARKAMLEVNCETDFVARNPEFQGFAQALANQVLESEIGEVESLRTQPYAADTKLTVDQAVSHQVATIGENIVLNRIALVAAADGHKLADYVHMGGKIGVVVEGSASVDDGVLHDVAMHIAATDPRYVSRDQVTEEILAAEREIALKQAIDQGKPEHIAQKIVDGKMEKFYEQEVLMEQPFAKDPSQSVRQVVAASGGDDATIARFVRFGLGETAAE